jgi:AcrR family transcriptional regulator
VSADERRARRRARLKEVCLDLIGESGVVSVTAEAVAGRAELTKRYFYESFADRDALLHEVMDDFFTEVRAEMLEALGSAGSCPLDRAHVVASVLINFLERDRRRARLYIEAAGQPTLQARREQAFDAFTRLLLDNVAEAKSDGHELAALIIVAGTTQAAISWLQGAVKMPREQVIAEIARMIIAALP